MNIRKNSASAGFYIGWKYIRMPIITTGNTERRIIMPKNPKLWRRSGTYTTAIMELTDTGA